MAGKILYTDAEELITNSGAVAKGGVGVAESDLGIVRRGALLWDSKKGILALGELSSISASLRKGAKKVSLRGKILTPALVDCHTHLIFAGSRHDELAMRLAGSSYQQIAASGGGIRSSVRATRAASPAELLKLARERVQKMRSLGVGVIEMKSGYGLDWPTEKKILEVAQKLKKEFRDLVFRVTFLGAHAFPEEATGPDGRTRYVNQIVDQMLPEIAKKKLADACDIFCDEGYFNRDETTKILTTARELGLDIKLHADELADIGGASLAADLGALSADHLLKANPVGLRAMGTKGVVAVALPSTAFYLGERYTSIEALREARVPIAVASDFNPGSSPSLHLPLAMSIACLGMGMTAPEAFAAATYGGARALGLQGSHGSLQVGMLPKMAIFNVPSYKALISQFAHPGLCEKVI